MVSEETRKKMRLSKLGERNPMFDKKFSKEHKAKLSKANSGSGNPMFGKHHSEETKMKISKAKTGKKGWHLSEETRAKIGKAKIGEKNPMWKGNTATKQSGRCRAIRQYSCPKGMERHHIDGNPLNNSPENIVLVTRKDHMKLDGRMKHRDKLGRFNG